ncbi:aldose epimerase family protein [Aquihabitans daechungensis]|uniref:aldose epimerase family protein n=1 Tax=Aquihabitans daechungensis TaxID=1052257 RepID=UPI003B9FA82B
MSAAGEVVPFGTRSESDASGRRDVALVPLQNSALAVSILTLGATLWSVEAPDRDGHREHVALHLPSLAEIEDRARNPYLGATCGRFAGRIAGASLALDGESVALASNEGTNQLHGGPDGFDRRIWDVAEVAPTDDGGRVVLALTSPDGDQGYPGTLAATATYELRGHVLRITYEAVTDDTTVVNLTNHAYWNLAGPAQWDLDRAIADHELRLPGERYLPVDADTIPVGGLASVRGTAHDLRQARLLGDVLPRLADGLDHAYEVPEGDDDGRDAFDGLRLAAELHHPASGRTLTVATDQPAVVAYTGNRLAVPFAFQAAVCLETQQYPDVVNRPGLGSAVLRHGERYRSTTELTFGTR